MSILRTRNLERRSPARFHSSRVYAQAFAISLLLLGLTANRAFAELPSAEQETESWWSDARWKYSIGLDYSRGDFDLEQDTELIYVPISVEADFYPVRVKLMLPILSIDGPSGALIDANGPTVQSSGLGQAVVSAGYLWVPQSPALPFFELTSKLNIPTETSRGLGSGDWAYSLQGDAFKRFGSASIFGRAGRKFYINSTLDDRFYTSVGTSLRLHDQLSVGIAFDWYQASSPSVDDTLLLAPFIGIKLGEKWSVGPYAVIGLSDGAPDYGAGFTLTLRR